MANRVVKTFTGDSSLTIPAGVTSVRLTAFARLGVTRIQAEPTYPQAMLLDPFGRLFTWGNNGGGQLGDSTIVKKSSPVAVLGGLKFAQVIRTSQGDNCYGITTDGVGYAWGDNNSFVGKNGDGTTLARSSPVAIAGNLRFARITGSGQHFCALTPDGSAYMWGDNSQGILGDGTIAAKSSPVAVVGGLKFSRVYTGNNQTFGITTSGDMYAWGTPNLGDGTSVAKSSPVAVIGGLKFVSVAFDRPNAGIAALTTTGAIYSWGPNALGQLGDGTQITRSSPVAVIGGLKFSSLSSTLGRSVYFAITLDGSAYGWGDNSVGGLGDGTILHRSSPVAVLGGLKFKRVINVSNPFGGYTSAGLTTSGDIYTWGANGVGLLGNNSAVTSVSSPVLVVGGLKFSTVDALYAPDGTNAFQAVATDGRVWLWGGNTDGQLGDGTIVNKSSPVALVGALAASLQESVVQKSVAVTPGTAYAILMNNFVPTFGGDPIGSGPIDVLQVEYFD
jgi:alpha-tubulin suppressor-like RCC1 family protein